MNFLRHLSTKTTPEIICLRLLLTKINHIFITYFRFDLRFSQSQNAIKIKIVEISPKLHFIGANIEETIQLQREHAQVHRKLQV